MKKSYILHLFLLAMMTIFASCSKEEITFESELPCFELRPGYQLLEVIVPWGTFVDDEIYIVGDFNGGVDQAVGDPRWLLQKAPDSSVKWGIYINPDDCIDGFTLADGYTFYNVEQGLERSLKNEDVIHHEVPAPGERINVLLYRWAEYFNDEDQTEPDIDHDGYVIYVVDNSGYEDLAMYAWGDAEAFGGWPGIKPTGEVTLKGVKYKYFDTGAANEGLNLNLIFNNNGGGQQLPDYNVTLNQDFYIELTPDGAIPFDPDAVVEHDGYTVYVHNLSGWDALYLYTWGAVDNLHGGWPGMEPTGTVTIKGVEYTYFDLGKDNCDNGLTQHVILNNGNGKQVDDVVVFDLDRDVYIELKSNSAREIDPADYEPEGDNAE